MSEDILVEIMDRTRLASDCNHPELPTCCPTPNGRLQPGSIITLYGQCPYNSGRFRVDLYASLCQHVRSADDKALYDASKRILALHFNARFNEGPDGQSYVLMNSYHDGHWDQDERSNEFPFQMKQPFSLMILTEHDCFKIFIDGAPKPLYQYKHRFPIGHIQKVHIEGPNLEVDLVEFREPLEEFATAQDSAGAISKMLPQPNGLEQPKPVAPPSNIAEVLPHPAGLVGNPEQKEKREPRSVSDAEATKFNSIELPSVPYFQFDPNLSKPCDIYLKGFILDPFEKYFVINLARTENDHAAKKTNIPLHISIRSMQAKFIRNSLIEGTWGQEETSFDMPFDLIPGAHFEMIIQNRTDLVNILINGKQCCLFKHRHDPTLIDTLEIKGSVQLHLVRYEFQ